MKLIDVSKSNRKNKKWVAEFCMCQGCSKCQPSERKFIHFGDSRYSDYTIHHDQKRRENYRTRAAAGKDAPADTAGSLAFHLLWGNSTSLRENIKAFKNMYNI